jgi:hypothetical protein
MVCEEEGISLEVLALLRGHWRSHKTVAQVHVCPAEDSCEGGAETGDDSCAEGTKDALCSNCEEDWFKQMDGSCEECDGGSTTLPIVAVCALLILVLGAVSYYVCWHRGLVAEGDLPGASSSPASSTGGEDGGDFLVRAKLTFDAWQIIKQFPSVFAHVSFPIGFLKVLSWVGTIVGLEIPQLMPAACYRKITHDSYMFMYTVFFTLVNLLIAAWWCCTRNPKRKARIFGLLLVGNFFIYSGMSNVIFSTFPCVDYDYGDVKGTRRLLRVDLGIDCDSSSHKLTVSWAGMMAIAYPLGVPIGYNLLLRWNKTAIMKAGRETDASLDPIRFLFANYSPAGWYFEPIVCVQKLVLVGVVVFFFPGTLSQLGITEAAASVFLGVYAWIKPFSKDSISLHGVSAQFCIMWIVLAAILISAAASAEKAEGPDSNYETGVMSVILIGLTAVPALLTLYWGARGCRASCVGAEGGEKDKENSGLEGVALEIRGGAAKPHKAIDVAI